MPPLSSSAVETPQTTSPEIERSEASRFLKLLDLSDTPWHFRALCPKERTDLPAARKSCKLQKLEQFEKLNLDGWGAFVVINAGGHSGKQITRIRALYVDFDTADDHLQSMAKKVPFTPTVVVESSPGKHHVYWVVEGVPVDQFKDAQQALITLLGSDKSVNDLPRVMRLPGYLHTKDKEKPFVSRIVDESGERYTWDEFSKWLKEATSIDDRSNDEKNGVVDDQGNVPMLPSLAPPPEGDLFWLGYLQRLLDAIPNDGTETYANDGERYDRYQRIMSAVHYETGGSEAGYDLARSWSEQSPIHNMGKDARQMWDSFGDHLKPAKVGTLEAIATGCSWRKFDTLVAMASELSEESDPVHVERLIKIAGKGVSPIECDRLLRTVKQATGFSLDVLRRYRRDDAKAARKEWLRQSAPARQLQPLPIENFPDVSFNEESGNVRILATTLNVEVMMDHYGVQASYDVIAKKTHVIVPGARGAPDNADNTALTQVISMAKLNEIDIGMVPDYVQAIGDRRLVNPVADWITSKPWDGVDRLPALCETLRCQPEYPIELRDTLVRRWLISAVAAALKPMGFRARGVLTLQGPQSIGKTSWLQSLVPDPVLRERLVKTDHHLDPSNKDSIVGAITHWLVELGELDSSFRKADVARIKGFLTSDMDRVRRPYDRLESEYQRRTVFFASVNNAQFLVDETGNTRFWTVPVVEVRYEHGIDMQQLWAQVAEEYERGVLWWLTPEEESQIEEINLGHRVTSSVRELIGARMDFNDYGNGSDSGWKRMSASEVLVAIGFDKPTNAQAREAGAVLREMATDPTKSKGVCRWLCPPVRVVQ